MSNKPEHLNHTAKTREELAREFGTENSPAFVNGILDSLRKVSQES